MIGDFHLHTNHSDGRLDPAALVDLIAAAGVTVFAVTDHDTTTSFAAAAARARARGMRCTCGIEITAYLSDRVVHVLGLGIDPDSDDLAALNEVALQVWDRNQCRWISSFAAQGITLERDFADHPIRLPVIIERLCLNGIGNGDPLTVHAMFRNFFAALPQAAYAELPTPARAAQIIRRAGGVALLAHPYPLLEAGLLAELWMDFDGIEARYGPYDQKQQTALEEVARRHNMLVSCGSDYHGYFTTSYRPPSHEAPERLLERLNL